MQDTTWSWWWWWCVSYHITYFRFKIFEIPLFYRVMEIVPELFLVFGNFVVEQKCRGWWQHLPTDPGYILRTIRQQNLQPPSKNFNHLSKNSTTCTKTSKRLPKLSTSFRNFQPSTQTFNCFPTLDPSRLRPKKIWPILRWAINQLYNGSFAGNFDYL